MAYSVQTWSDGNASYPVSASRMGNIETGIHNAAATADQGLQILTTTAKLALSLPAGSIVYDTTLLQLQIYTGSAWVALWDDTGWQVPSYTNSWTNSDGPAAGGTAAGYRRQGQCVYMAGRIQTGTSGTAAFTLPAGFRPAAALYVPTVTTGSGIAVGVLTISSAGVVTPSALSYTVLSINCSFLIN